MGLFSKEADRDYANCDTTTFYARHGGSPVVDQPQPAPDPEPTPVPGTASDDFIVRIRTHNSNLIIEPATIPIAFTPKPAKQTTGLNQAWQDYILALNGGDQRIYDKIADPAWGPSTGIGNGKLWLIGLAYWLQIVRHLETVTGVDGKPWYRIACFGINDSPPAVDVVNYKTTPWLIHHVTMQNKYNQLIGTGNPVTDGAYVPLVAERANQMFIPASLVSRVAMIAATPAVNVRSDPTVSAAVVGRVPRGDAESITCVQLGDGGVWAQSSLGWFALRYNGAWLTDWRV